MSVKRLLMYCKNAILFQFKNLFQALQYDKQGHQLIAYAGQRGMSTRLK